MISIGQKERELLAICQHGGDLSINEIAKKAKGKDHIVRHALEKLKEAKVVFGAAPFINVLGLGFHDFTFFITPLSVNDKNKNLLMDELIKSDKVAWLALTGGEYQMGISILSRRADEAIDFLHNLRQKCAVDILDKALSVRVRYYAFGRKYLNTKYKIRVFSNQNLKQRIKIDKVDKKILSALSNLQDESFAKLALKIKIPLSTFIRRVENLKKSEILQGFITKMDSRAFGMQQYRMLLFAQGMDGDLSRILYKYASEHPQITHYFECLGSWDYEFVIEVQNPENLNEVAEQILKLSNGKLRNVKLLETFRHVKFHAYPFGSS